MMAWNRLPRALRLAFVVWVGLFAARIALFALDPELHHAGILDWLNSSIAGVQLVALVGLLQLARRWPSLGVRFVIGAAIAQLVASLGYYVLGAFVQIDPALGERIFRMLSYAAVITDALAIIGWAIAARSAVLGIVAGVAELIVVWADVIDGSMGTTQAILENVGSLVVAVVTIAMAIGVARGRAARTPEPPSGVSGLPHGLWIVAIAALALPILLGSLGKGELALGAVEVTMVVGTVLFARGAIALADEPGAAGWLATVAALLAFIAVGDAASSIVELFDRFIRDMRSTSSLDDVPSVTMFVTGMLAELAAVAAVVASALARGARPVAIRVAGAGVLAAGLFAVFAVVHASATGLDGSLFAGIAGAFVAAAAAGHGVARMRSSLWAPAPGRA